MSKRDKNRGPSLYQHDISDRGPSGLAFASRPFVMASTGAVSRGSIAPAAVSEAKRMTDTILIDRMHAAAQLSDRQHQVAKQLYRMKHSANLSRRVTANLGYVHDRIEEAPDDGDEGLRAVPIVLDDDETWRDRLNRIMRQFGDKQAELLWHLLDERHPGMSWLATTQECLGKLADQWGLEK